MFSLFKKSSPEIPYTDKVWQKHEYMLKGMFMMAMSRLQAGKSSLVVSFFPDEVEQLQNFLNQHNLAFTAMQGRVDQAWQHPAIYVAEANVLKDLSVQSWLKQNAMHFSGTVFFPAHYPISMTEQATLKTMQDVGFNEFVFCLSFDDPLMAMFGSSNILPLLEKLGMEEMEAIEHTMVTTAIQRARKKVLEKIAHEKPARSLQEWFALNVKS